jgi:DNA-binding NarL/FixJ family response regulator
MPLRSHSRKGPATAVSNPPSAGGEPDRPRAKTRLFLVDDEPIVRRGLRFLIDLKPDLVVCGEAEGELEAFEAVLSLQPDVAIVDLSLKEGSGLTLIQRLHRRCPALKLLAFSMHAEAHFVASAFAAGAQGYVIKGEGTEHVLEALEAIRKGGYYLSESVAAQMPGLLPRTGPHSRAWASKPGSRRTSGDSA